LDSRFWPVLYADFWGDYWRYWWEALGREPAARAYYLGGVGVLPMMQGRGVGRWLMQQADAVTVANGCKAIRFDAVSFNQPLLRFYDSLGYERRREFSTESGKGMICYERTFSP
ncbi:MAG: GNAT family N-acetyltransferase, partial [Anaerolineae bacterium]|nr:GNAT family N-acetyltransferase [Anaerolineae bacterium]